jgi:hypothetical protein
MGGGMLPQESIITPHIFEWLKSQDTPRPTADGTLGRASDAGKCSRQMAFRMLEVEPDRLVPPETLMAFNVGNRFHETVQAVMKAAIPTFEAEVVGTYKQMGIDVSCHADGMYVSPDYGVTCAEIKTISGYGFKLAVGQAHGDDPPGPKAEHVCQAAICGAAPQIAAQSLHMIYIDKDKGGIAEWILGMDVPYPFLGGSTPRQYAEADLERMMGVMGRIESGMLPVRYIPGVGKVESPPAEGSRGKPWQCRYCSWQPTCAGLPTAAVEIDVMESLRGETDA